MTDSSNIDALARKLAQLLSTPETRELRSSNDANDLVDQTAAWAVGLWKKTETDLHLMCFGCANGFDAQVADEFQAATLKVPLEQTQLGIVNAVVNQRPALARVEEQSGDLRKSAGWLERFGARCSLSCPISNQNDQIVGVLAVSWAEAWQLENEVPQNLLSLADKISKNL
ncbi:MAG TPA: hypothetical protein DD473_11330 [Planctomycetaceae bacterium]|nr:hypothetical protein [Planctomycetaceae bacterium]